MADDIADVLERKREELEEQLALLSAPTPDTAGISFGKRVGDGTSIAVERLAGVASHDRLQQMLAEVIRAQQKVEEGTHGLCDVDSQPIDPARMDALPWATRCVQHSGS